MLGATAPGTPLGRDEAAAAADVAAGDSSHVAEEIDAMGRARARSDREADAERRLAELKRRMGK
jgi:hypothetical protein